jgi:hypothetical protein
MGRLAFLVLIGAVPALAGVACGYDGAATSEAEGGPVEGGPSPDGGCGLACGTGDGLSILSPFDPSGTLTFQRVIDWTIAARDPAATLHYTTDGSMPTLGSPMATGLVTLKALPDGARIQWLVGASTKVNTFDVHVQPALSSALHTIVEHVTFDLSKSPYVTVPPGTKVVGHADWQGWNQDSCPLCVDQLAVGIDTAEGCIIGGIPGRYPGQKGTSVQFTVTAPAAPGSYPVKIGVVQTFNCMPGARSTAVGSKLSNTVIGLIEVR